VDRQSLISANILISREARTSRDRANNEQTACCLCNGPIILLAFIQWRGLSSAFSAINWGKSARMNIAFLGLKCLRLPEDRYDATNMRAEMLARRCNTIEGPATEG
jgi:hypothetical protein